jgi:hypothetical protein
VQGDTIIGPGYGHRHESNGFLEFWKYPQGGAPSKPFAILQDSCRRAVDGLWALVYASQPPIYQFRGFKLYFH